MDILKNKKEFSKSIKTVEEAGKFINFADLVLSKTYKTDIFSLQESIPTDVGEWGSVVLSFFKNANLEGIRKGFNDLKEYVQTLESINVSIPIKPSKEFINELYKILEESGYGEYLINLEVEKKDSLETGFSIEGKFLNFSLKDLIRKHLVSKDVINRNI